MGGGGGGKGGMGKRGDPLEQATHKQTKSALYTRGKTKLHKRDLLVLHSILSTTARPLWNTSPQFGGDINDLLNGRLICLNPGLENSPEFPPTGKHRDSGESLPPELKPVSRVAPHGI